MINFSSVSDAISSGVRVPFSIAAMSSERSIGLIIKRKIPSDCSIKVARPGANKERTSLEKNPTMQSTFEDTLNAGINTSAASESRGNI